MIIKRFTILFLLSVVFSFDAFCQISLIDDDTELKGIIYRKEFSVDARLHTNGFAIGANFGDITTYYKTKFYNVEIGTLSDPRESSQNRNLSYGYSRISNSFKYGKQNSIIVLRAGKGVRKYVSEKAKRKGVAVGYYYHVGPSLAVTKPYYLDLIYQVEVDGTTNLEINSQKYSSETAEKFLNYRDIYGSSKFGKGLREIGIIPGVQSKVGMFFAIGASDKYIKSIETGLMADIFIKKVPIMVETLDIKNKPYFINLYVNLQFGYRSN